jgi:hypothetical protein
VKFAICNEIFQGWNLPDTFAYARKAGYDAVEIAPFTIARSVRDIPGAQRSEIRRMASDAGVGISAIHWVLEDPTFKYSGWMLSAVFSAGHVLVYWYIGLLERFRLIGDCLLVSSGLFVANSACLSKRLRGRAMQTDAAVFVLL